MSFNCPHFLQEFRSYVLEKVFELKVLEVGCYSGEMLETLGTGVGLSLETDKGPLAQKWCKYPGMDVRNFAKRGENQKRWDLVFCSGVLESYGEDEALEIVRAMARLSKKWVLIYAVNEGCAAYRQAREEAKKAGITWGNEYGYTLDGLVKLCEQASLKVVDQGYAARKWVERFGGREGADEPYLVYCLAEVKPQTDEKSTTEK